jgi:hypothetical protein
MIAYQAIFMGKQNETISAALVLLTFLAPISSAHAAYIFAYKHDEQGKPLGGSIKKLQQAIRAGQDIQVMYASNGTQVYLPRNLVYLNSDGSVVCENTSNISTRNVENAANFGLKIKLITGMH